MNVFMCKMGCGRKLFESNEFTDLISTRKLKKFKKNSKKVSAQQSLVGEILARIGFCHMLKVPSNELVFSSNEFNKPLLQVPSGFYFNISHSGEWVVCAFSSHNVGIDVERIKGIEYHFAQHLFHEKEYASLLNQNKGEQLRYFFRLWTLKESYIKAIGKGLNIPLNSFCMSENNLKFFIRSDCEQQNTFFQHYNIDESHLMSICTFEQVSSNITLFSLEEVMELAPLLNQPIQLGQKIAQYNKPVRIHAGEGRYSLCY